MDVIFTRALENDLADFPGLVVDASIPVTEAVLNDLIGAVLRENQHITAAHVSIEEQNRLEVTLRTPLWPWPLQLNLKLFHSVDLTSSPAIRAFLENHVLLGKLGAFLKILPEGIRIYEDQLSVDLGSFLTDGPEKRLLELVQSVDIHSEAGRLILNVKIAR